MAHARSRRLNEDDYLDGELHSDVRHEYVDGEVFAMAGAGEKHNLIALNVAARLRTEARGGPCRVFIADMKVRVAAWNAFYYPDIVVTCAPADDNAYFKERSCLIVEVLSPSTERTDRREKMLAYRTLESLREYVLIDSETRTVEVYRKEGAGDWSFETVAAGDTLRLDCIGVAPGFDDIYEDVSL